MARFFREIGMREKSKNPEPVIHADYDDALLRQIAAILTRLRGGTGGKPAAVDPNHHGQTGSRGMGGHP